MCAIPGYNKIDLDVDDKAVIEAKVEALKAALEKGDIDRDAYAEEKMRVEQEIADRGLNYAFNW